jgi:hypothetical protein
VEHPNVQRIAEVGPLEVFRRDPCDGKSLLVDGDRPADDARIAAEGAEPRPVTQDDRRHVAITAEERTKVWPDAEDVKVINGDPAALPLHRLLAVRQPGPTPILNGDVGEHGGMFTIVLVLGGAQILSPATRIHAMKSHQSIWIDDGNCLEMDRVEEAEHGRVGSNADTDGNESHSSQTRGAFHLPQGESQILPDAVHPRQQLDLSACLEMPQRRSELANGLSIG